jgi:ribosomal protein S18 acetylase RimI-like enzyme
VEYILPLHTILIDVRLPKNMDDICKNLSAAMINDPFYGAITIDYEDNPAERLARLGEYFRYSIDEGHQVGVCVLPEHQLGASVWLKPQPPEVSAQAFADKLAALSKVLGKQGFENYRRIHDFMTPHTEAVIDHSAWYLSILGVSPNAQGKGVGRSLVEPVLTEVDREKVTSYLETFNQRALTFYNRLGFLEVASHVEPITNQTYWILVRQPQNT